MNINFFKKTALVFSLLFSFSFCVIAQNNPFANEIKQFELSDLKVAPLPGKIVFAGSSSFTKWKDINQYFPGYAIINRGFGGSTLPDLIQYTRETILQYKPKQVVIYCGENDLASSDTITPQIVLERFTVLFNTIRAKLGKQSTITFISIKPSVSRWRLESKIVETNKLITTFLAKHSNTQFVDIHSAMLQADGQVMPNIFIEDRLHMNAGGYAIWQKIMAPYLMVN